MDKKSIIGIAVVAVLFLGFAYFNSQQQKEYLEQKAAYEAYVDSVAAAARAAAPVADSLASGNGVQAEVAAAEAAAAVRERQVETLGESLTAAREAEAEEFIVENDVMAVLFSTRGGQIKGVTLKDGKDVTVIATGLMVQMALKAREMMAAEGVSVRVIDMHTIKPLDVETVTAAINEVGKIITVEDHNILNGLGSAVCEIAAEMGKGIVKRVGIQDQFGQSAPYERLLAMNGVTVENITEIAETLVKG